MNKCCSTSKNIVIDNSALNNQIISDTNFLRNLTLMNLNQPTVACCITGPQGLSITGPQGLSITGPQGLSITGPQGLSITGPQGLSITGPQGSFDNIFGWFYGLTAGTDNGGSTEYAATIAVNTPINFAHQGASIGGIVINNMGPVTTQTDNTQFVLPTIGIYKVTYVIHSTEQGQWIADVGDGTIQNIVIGSCGVNADPTSGGHLITQTFCVTTTLPNRILRIINPAGNATALTITPANGSLTHANSPTLTIEFKSS